MPRITVKDKIIETAGRLFYQQGYNLTGIDEVIEKAGIARGSLYYHFDSKTDLLLAWLDTHRQNWYANLEATLKPITDPKKKLLALFDYRIESQERNEFCGCVNIKINDEAGLTDPRILQKVQQSKDRLKAMLLDIIGQIKHNLPLTTDELTHMIYTMIEGGTTSTSIYKDVNELKKAKKIVAKLL